MPSMKLSEENKRVRTAAFAKLTAIVLCVGVFIGVVVYVGVGLGRLLGAAVFSAVAAYLLMPLQRYMETRFGKGVSALICVVILFGSIVGGIAFLLPVLTKQIISASGELRYVTEFVERALERLDSYVDSLGIPISVDDVLIQIVEFIEGRIALVLDVTINAFMEFVKSIPVLILVPVMCFYMIKDRAYFISKAQFIVPVKWRKPISNTITGADRVIKSYIKTQLVIAFLVGAATVVGYLIVGVPNALLFGLIMGICEIIPYFGPVIGAVPACLVALADDPAKLIWTVAVVVAVQQLENVFLSPFVMGTHFDINPLMVIAVLWFSGGVFGFWGFIFGIPIYVIVRNVLGQIFNKVVKIG